MNTPITYEEVGRLLALAAARDQRTTGDADILAWHADLTAARVTYDDAADALTQFYAVDMPRLPPDRRRRVTTSDVIAIVRRIRDRRLQNFSPVRDYEPGSRDESGPEFTRRLRAQMAEVAQGQRPAALPPAGGGRGRGVVAGRVVGELGEADVG